MRVLCENDNYAISVEHAKINGKRLLFITYSGERYFTDEYFHENIAFAKLNDLVVNGYIMVKELHILG